MEIPLPLLPGIAPTSKAPEQHASYSLAREARKQEQSGMKPSEFLKKEQSISDWRRDAAV
jgi:hypothetical protein